MKFSKIVVSTVVLLLFIILSVVSISAINAPKMNILALNLTLDLVLVISVCAIVTAAVCIGLKLYRKNHRAHK
jgi:hypothetical protein